MATEGKSNNWTRGRIQSGKHRNAGFIRPLHQLQLVRVQAVQSILSKADLHITFTY